MPVGESDSGSPSRIYPGLPDRDRWDGLAEQVQSQVAELVQLRDQPSVRHQMLELLQDRRRIPSQAELERTPGPGQTPADPGRDSLAVTQFDYLPEEAGFDTLVVRDELLITRDSYAAAKSHLDRLGLELRPIGCRQLDEEILKLVPGRNANPGEEAERETRVGSGNHMEEAQQLADTARNLRKDGHGVSSVNVTPLMGVVKPPPRPKKAVRPSNLYRQDEVERVRPVEVAVIDTGIWAERLQNVQFGSQVDPLHEFPLWPSEEACRYLDLDAGHGTFVTGIVQQVAPRAGVTVYRAVDSDGIGSEVTVACKIIEAVNNGAKIINLSLGCQTQDDYPPIALHQAVKYAGKNGVLVVAAAGNYADTRPCWPAAFRGVVSVAGLAPDLTPAPWSSQGFWVTCSTIGQGLLSSFVDGVEEPLPGTPANGSEQFTGPDPWAVWSGTSFAAAQITGLLAQRYQASDGETPRDVLRGILSDGRSLPDFGQTIEILPGI
jgi:hypothetical protein